MHDLVTSTIVPDSVVHHASPGNATAPAPQALGPSLTLPLNALSPLDPTFDGIVAGGSVDVINNLTQGALYQVLANTPPGPRTRTYQLDAFPDTGAGNLGFPSFGAVPGLGTITSVDNNGVAVTQGGAGITLAGGAKLASLDPISPNLSLTGGWSLTLSLRTPLGTKNAGKIWASIGKYSNGDFGITVTESTAGALVATVADPRQPAGIKVQSLAYPKNAVASMRLVWDSVAQLLQWYVNGVASGAAVPLTFVPEIGNGIALIGTSLSQATNLNPIGAIYSFGFGVTGADQTQTLLPVGPSVTLSAADAATLQVDTTDIFTSVASAGDISLSWQTASGRASSDTAFAFAGYVAPVEILTSYVSGEVPFAPADLGQTRADISTLVLTPPFRGKLQTALSTTIFGAGALSPVLNDGLPPHNYVEFLPNAGGKAPGLNPNGSTLRGGIDLLRTQQNGAVRVTNIVEMNRAPKLNGGGEVWGHADDVWVPLSALIYEYNETTFLYPTLGGETPGVTVTALPGAGEGTIRVLRTGADLKIGSTIPFASVKQLGWAKTGVAQVSAGCHLGLAVTAPGAPTSSESYALTITDAARPTAFAYWSQADILFSDRNTRTRWAARGGDWLGVDGVWGTVPFVATPTLSAAQSVTIDVTRMVQGNVGYPEFFIIPPSSGNGLVSIVPSNYSPDNSKEPMLRVTGGARAGTYRATRGAGLVNSDTGSWKPTNVSPFLLLRGQALLLGFDSAGTGGSLADATKIELILSIAVVVSGGSGLQLFRPAPQTPRPGARIAVQSTPTQQRADLICKVDTSTEWLAMLNDADSRNSSGGGQPANFTLANGCYYGGIPTGFNSGMSLLKGFWKADGSGGYPTVRFGRMVGWHTNYHPTDADLGTLVVSGKSPGIATSTAGSFATLTAGFGGRQVTGFTGYAVRSQRGAPSQASHPPTSPLAGYLAFGDYDYFLSGSTNGLTTYATNALPRMRWIWIESVHSTNSVFADGTWANDGVYELYVNGRKQCESRRLEYRVAGNAALWDTLWFDEYNGGQSASVTDRLWPYVIGPSYVVSGTAPIAPPPGWNVPFVTAAGTPDTVPLAYSADF